MIQLGSAYGEIQIGTGDAEQSVNSLAASMRKVGGTMSLAISAPLAAIAAAGLNAAADFEQSLNVVQQVSGATESAMKSLQAQAIQLGADTSFSAGEAAEGMLELAKAGMNTDQVMAAIGGTLDLAAAGNLSVAQAAEIAANAINSFNLPAEEAGRVADLLAAAANSSSVEVTDMAYGFQMAGAVFASNKQSIDDLSTAIAILGNNGLKGSDAGTSLKTMLMALAAPTDKASAALKELGVQVYNADGSMKGFEDIVGSLESATAGLSDAQRNAAFTTIFGSDAIRAANILVSEGADEFGRMKDAVNAEGAASKVAGARMNGLRGAIEYAKGTIESTLIAAILPLTDGIAALVRQGADLIGSFASLPEPVRMAALAFAGVLAAAGPLLMALSTMGTVLGALLSPIGLVIAGVAALAAGFVLWQSNFGGVQQKTAQLLTTLRDMAEAATGIDFDGVADGLRSFGNYMRAVVEDGDALNDWLTHLPDPVQPAVQALGELVAAFGDLVQTGDFGAFVADIQAIDWGGALGSLGDSLVALRDSVVTALQTVDWGAALTAAGELFNDLTAAVKGAWDAIPWETLLGAAGELFNSLTASIAAAWAAIPWDTILGVAADLFGQLTAFIATAWALIPWNTLLGAAASLFDKLTGAIAVAWAAIPWDTLLGVAADLFGGLTGFIADAWNSIPWGTLLGEAGALFNRFTTFVVDAWSGIPWDTLLGAAADLFGGLTGFITDAWAAVPWGALLGEAGALFNDLTASITAAWNSISWGTLLDAGGDALGGLTSSVVTAIQSIPWGEALSAAGNVFMLLAGWVTAKLREIPWGTALETAAGWLDALRDGVVGAVTSIDWGAALTAAGSFLGTLTNGVIAALQGIDWAGALAAVGGWLNGLTNGVIAAIQAIDWGTALTAAGDWLAGLTGGVISAVTSVDWGGLLTAAGDWLADLWGGVSAALAAIDWGTAITNAATWLDGLTQGAVEALQTIDWGTALTAAGDYLAGLWGGVVSAVTAIDWGTHLTAAGEWLAGFTQSVIGAIQAIDWGGALAAAGDFLANLWGGVVAAVQGIDWGTALSTATTWLTNLSTQVVGAIQGFDWNAAMTAAGDVFAGLETAVTGALSSLGFTGAADALAGIKAAFAGLPELIDSAKTSFSGLMVQLAPIAAMLAAFFAPSLERLRDAFAALPEKLGPLLPKLQELAGAFGGLVQALAPFVALVGAGLALAANLGVNLLTAAFDRLPGILEPIISQVTATIKLVTAVLTEVVEGVTAIASGDWAAAWESLKTIVNEFMLFIGGTWLRLTQIVGGFGGIVGQAVTDTLADLGLTEAAAVVQSIIDKITELGTAVTEILSGERAFSITVPEWLDSLLEWDWPKLAATAVTWLSNLLKWKWPELSVNPVQWLATLFSWDWPTFPSLPQWVSDLFAWDWPSFDMPDWLNDLFNFKWPSLPDFSGGLDGNPATPYALGTSFAHRGLALVGERGPELIDLRGGERIYDAGDTSRLLGRAEPQIVINATLNNELDIHQLAYQVAAEWKRQRR